MREVSAEADTPLLLVIREQVPALTGTKYGCGSPMRRRASVHVNGEVQRFPARFPLGDVKATDVIVTIEWALSAGASQPGVQKAGLGPTSQFGYPVPGRSWAAAALLKKEPQPTDQDTMKR